MTEELLSKLEREGCGNCGILVAEIRRLTSGRKVWADPGDWDNPCFAVDDNRVNDSDRQYYLVPVEPGDEEATCEPH